MTLSDLAPSMAPEATMSTPNTWSETESTPKLPPFGPSNLTARLEAKAKMRLSVQMARVRAKIPFEERPPLPPAANNNKGLSTGKIENAAAAEEPAEPTRPHTPAPPCNACILPHDRSIVMALLGGDGDSSEENVPLPVKERKPPKRLCGWESSSDLLCKKPAAAAESRVISTAKSTQRRCTTSSGGNDLKIKINLYDRYTANTTNDTFKFFHYADLRLYIKQYRRNHAYGASQRGHHASVSPAYNSNIHRRDDRPYGYGTRTSDGFVLGFQSTPVTPHLWKASLPIPAFRHKVAKERKQPVEEPILSPRVFVRQNGAFSHLWKTREDGTPDPFIAVTRPPTTSRVLRPTCTESSNKENQSESRNPTRITLDRDSPGDLTRETPAWRIMRMIASSSRRRSHTDGSDLTTTNECKSQQSDIDSSLDQEKSRDTGEISSSSASPEDELNTPGEESPLEKLKAKYSLLTNIPHNERSVVYNRTRSILSNMSNLLNYYIESENPAQEPGSSPDMLNSGNAKLKETAKVLERDEKEAASRKQLLLLRKELKNIASRRSPSRMNQLPSPGELNKIGSLVVPGSKTYDLHRPNRCNTTPHKLRKTPVKEIRRTSPSPMKTGHAGYKKVMQTPEHGEMEENPILFVKRSQLLPTVSASVEAMKSRQMMLHTRTVHPADSKQFTKITDLLRNQIISRIPSSTGTFKRVSTRSNSIPEARHAHSSHTRLK